VSESPARHDAGHCNGARWAGYSRDARSCGRCSCGDAAGARRMDAVVGEPHALESQRKGSREDARRGLARHPQQRVQLRATRWPVAVWRRSRQLRLDVHVPRREGTQGESHRPRHRRRNPEPAPQVLRRAGYGSCSGSPRQARHVRSLHPQGRWGDRQGAIHRLLGLRLSDELL